MSQALCEASCKKYRCFLRKKCEGGKSRNMMHEKWMYWMVAMQNHLLQSLKLEIQNHSIIRNSRMWLLQSGSYRCTAGRRATGLVKASLRTQLGLDIFNLKMEKKSKINRDAVQNATNLKIYRTKPKWSKCLKGEWRICYFQMFPLFVHGKIDSHGSVCVSPYQAPALGSERPPRARRPWRPQHDQHLQLEEVPKCLTSKAFMFKKI